MFVPFLESDAAVDVVVECPAGDGAVDVSDESAGTVGHTSMLALGCDGGGSPRVSRSRRPWRRGRRCSGCTHGTGRKPPRSPSCARAHQEGDRGYRLRGDHDDTSTGRRRMRSLEKTIAPQSRCESSELRRSPRRAEQPLVRVSAVMSRSRSGVPPQADATEVLSRHPWVPSNVREQAGRIGST